jgi:hypothetical protein
MINSSIKDIYKHHKASKTLQRKAGTGSISPEKVIAAQKTLDENNIDFRAITMDCAQEIHKVFDVHKHYHNSSPDFIRMMSLPILTIKGMAGMCGYPPLSLMADRLLHTIDKTKHLDDDFMEITKGFLLSVKFLVSNEGSTSNSTYTAALASELDDACARYEDKISAPKETK